MKYIEEEITLIEFAERFLGINDITTPCEFDTKDLGIEVLGKGDNGDEYNCITKFIVKDKVSSYYTDGNINVTSNHILIDGGEEIQAKNHKEFKLVDLSMHVVDMEVADSHNYYANGRLNHNTTSGGKALAFHSSVRLRLKAIGQIKKGDGVVGIKCRAQVVKNRMGPPLRHSEYDMYFLSGIDNYGGWLNVMKDYDIAKLSGAWYTMKDNIGEEIRFQAKEWAGMLTNLDFKEHVYTLISECLVMKYKPLSVDEVQIEDGDIGAE